MLLVQEAVDRVLKAPACSEERWRAARRLLGELLRAGGEPAEAALREKWARELFPAVLQESRPIDGETVLQELLLCLGELRAPVPEHVQWLTGTLQCNLMDRVTRAAAAAALIKIPGGARAAAAALRQAVTQDRQGTIAGLALKTLLESYARGERVFERPPCGDEAPAVNFRDWLRGVLAEARNFHARAVTLQLLLLLDRDEPLPGPSGAAVDLVSRS